MNITIRDNFKKGFVEMMVLSLLRDGDLYGYEMVKLIKERCGGYLAIPEGSLYPTLYKLQDKNCITSEKKLIGKRMTKVFYHLEDAGRQYLDELLPEFYATIEAVRKVIEYKGEG